MSLSTRLTIAMVALVILTATAIGWLSYRNIAAVALPSALDRIDTHTRLVATELETSVRSARIDVRTQGRGVDGLVQATIAGGVHPIDRSPAKLWRDRLASRFIAELEAKPSYLQFRLIGAADGGRDIVHVDRRGPGGAIRVVPDGELERSGDADYFNAAIALPSGDVHASTIDLAQRNGVVETPRIPVQRVAAPIHAPNGTPFGILVVTIDLRAAFAHIRSAAGPESAIYLVNHRGDFLIHPRPDREFEFKFGTPFRVQDEFPDFAQLMEKPDTKPRIMRNRIGQYFGIGWEAAKLADGPPVFMIEAVPYARVAETTIALRDSIVIAGTIAVLIAFLLAVILARSLTRPLVQMTAAVKGHAANDRFDAPTGVSGEIGVLGDAFKAMMEEVQASTAALTNEIEERRRIFDTSPDLILVTDRRGTFSQVNPSAEATLGYSPTEMIGRSAKDFIYPDDLDRTREEMRAARRGHVIRNFETRYIRKDRRVVIMEWSGVWSEPTKQYFFVGRDMTEQKLAEEKFRLAVEASPSGLVMIDDSGAIVLINAETERMFGYKRHELIGQPVDILVPLRLRGHHVQHRTGFAAQPSVRRMGAGGDLYGLRKDGTEFSVEIGLNPIQTPTGTLVMSVIVDITESMKAEQALRASEQMARAIIETALDAFVQLNQDGTVAEWSPQAEAMFGWTRGEAAGRSLGELIIPPDRRVEHLERHSQFVSTAASGKLGSRFEIDAIRRDGKSMQIEVAVTALRRGDSFVTNGFIRDLTEKRAAEERLRQAQKMESVGQLTGGIAHDFNNMLTVITGTIDILAEAVADRPELAAIAKLISEAADRGAELTGHLLAFARKQPLQPREIDINALMIETGKLLRPTLGGHIEIETILKPQAWSALVDPGQLSAAMLNLAINARDAMPNGGKLTLETSNAILDQAYANANSDVQPGNYVMIAVSDSGKGIPEAIREKVFEPFFTTKEVGKGTGLGLSMVYGFVKQSGGHIKVYSEEGHGTTFKLYLPQAGAQPSEIAETPPDSEIELGTETVLVVEDDALVRTYVIAQLKSLGYETLSAANAAEALAIADDGTAFDLLFTDVIMPGQMNGRQLAEVLLRKRATIKVLFTSGYTENAIIHHGRLDPGVLLLAKPYRKSELARMLRRALGAANTLPDRVDRPQKSRAN